MHVASRIRHRSSSISRSFGGVFFFSRRGGFYRCGFPAAERQMYRHRSWLPIARVKFSCRRNNAIRHYDTVKSNEENVFTRDFTRRSDSRSLLISWSANDSVSLGIVQTLKQWQLFMTVQFRFRFNYGASLLIYDINCAKFARYFSNG